jgi:hypothetical protein
MIYCACDAGRQFAEDALPSYRVKKRKDGLSIPSNRDETIV